MSSRPPQEMLPIGLCKETSTPKTISDVQSGLACNCNCPSCGNDLIAKKGPIKKHHFAHASVTECVSGPESGLHLFAKHLISQKRILSVPPVTFTLGELTETAHEMMTTPIENTQIEKSFNEITVDVAATFMGEPLFIEIAVTHFCPPEKTAKLRQYKVDTVEIDLSHVDWFASFESLANAILYSAPRKWLYNNDYNRLRKELTLRVKGNRKRTKVPVTEATTDLSEQDKTQLQVLERQLKLITVESFTNDITEATGSSPLSRVCEAGYETVIGVNIKGASAFSAPARLWQSAIIDQFVLKPIKDIDRWYLITVPAIFSWMARQNLIKEGFHDEISKPLEKHLKAAHSDFDLPANVITTFLEHLSDKSLLRSPYGTDRFYKIHPDLF